MGAIQKEVSDTIYNIEHIEERGKATMFLRSIFMIACFYLGVGCCIKSQMYNARGVEMIPHVGFWSEYPGLVFDGWTYAQILAGGWLGSPAKTPQVGLSGGLGGRAMTRGVG